MRKKTIQQVFWAIVLVAAQILLFNNLQMRGLLNTFVAPSIYIFYLLIMPMGASKVSLLFTSFLLGISVDIFSGSLGINAAACVLIGFVRPKILRLFYTHEERNSYVRPSIYTMGMLRFFYYALALSFSFHFALFFLEVFTFHEFYFTLIRIILSSMVSAAIMMIFQFLFAKKEHQYR